MTESNQTQGNESCGYQGYEFGARYPDSVCYEGRLLDADHCDSEGNLYDQDEDIPCPMCRRADAVKWHAGRFSGTYKERLKAARALVADIINNRKTGRFPL
jgi:hypothetical protein